MSRDGAAAVPAARRPNFLLFMTDQQRADHLGAYGNTQLRTPNIDALAANGIAFDRMYVNSPVCMPNRACIATGRMPSAAGSRMNGVPLSLESRTFMDFLREAGYRTALVGKAHFQNMTENAPTPVPGQDRVPRSRQASADQRDGPGYRCESPEAWRDPEFRVPTPYYGFDEAILCLEHGDQVGGDFARWLSAESQARRLAPGAGPGPEHALPADRPIAAPQSWRTSLDRDHYPSAYIAERTVEWLGRHAQAARRDAADAPGAPATGADAAPGTADTAPGTADAAPFFLQCSFPDPHHPFNPPEPYWSMYDPDEIELPESFNAMRDSMPPHKAAIHREFAEGRRKTSGSRVIAVDETEARQAIALNYGAIAMIDDCVGRVLRALDDLGLAENTVVIFLSDHGDYMGDHGLLFKGPLHYQSLVRMPFIWRDCDPSARAGRCARVARAMDIAPTILERAGVPLPHGMQGRSLIAELRGDPRAPDCALIEEESHRNVPGLPDPPKVRTLVTERWRISVFAGADWGELYDLQEDPHELRNLFSDPGRAELRAELLWKMASEMTRLAPNLPLAPRMA